MKSPTEKISDRLMQACHYPGSSVPPMGETVRSRMPRQKPKRSFKGGKPGSKSPPNYDYRADAYEG